MARRSEESFSRTVSTRRAWPGVTETLRKISDLSGADVLDGEIEERVRRPRPAGAAAYHDRSAPAADFPSSRARLLRDRARRSSCWQSTGGDLKQRTMMA